MFRSYLRPVAQAAIAFAGVMMATAAVAQVPSYDKAFGQTPDTGSAALASAPALTSQTATPELPQLAEGILMSVNEDMITSYDLKQRMLLLIVTSGVQVTNENYTSFQQQALNSLIDERLEKQEMIHWKVDIGDKEIDSELDRMAAQSGMNAAQLLAELKNVGIEPTTLREQIRAQTGWNALVGGRYNRNAAVGSAQVDSLMDKVIADGQKPQYQVAEIYLDAAHAGGMANAQSGAKQLYEQIKAKAAPFQAVARQFSDAPSAANGGDAGWLVSGNIDPAVESVLQQLNPGEMSPPIATKDGVYIYLLRQKSNGNADIAVRLTQASISLPAGASASDEKNAMNALDSFRSKAPTCSAVQNLTGKAPGNIQITDLGEAKLSDLQPAYASALRPLKDGQSTGPARNSVNVNVLYACDRRLAAADALTREQIESRLVNQRLSMLGKRYLRELHGTATIENHTGL